MKCKIRSKFGEKQYLKAYNQNFENASSSKYTRTPNYVLSTYVIPHLCRLGWKNLFKWNILPVSMHLELSGKILEEISTSQIQPHSQGIHVGKFSKKRFWRRLIVGEFMNCSYLPRLVYSQFHNMGTRFK